MRRNKKHSKHKSLKRQLKKTLTERASVTAFKPTNFTAAHWFGKLNAALFGGRLGRVHIIVKKLHHDWGRCVADWDNRQCRKGTFNQRVIPYNKAEVIYRIELHCKFPTWKDFIETLAHEMVHLYQMTVLQDPYSNHNENFYSFRPVFRSAGLKLYR